MAIDRPSSGQKEDSKEKGLRDWVTICSLVGIVAANVYIVWGYESTGLRGTIESWRKRRVDEAAALVKSGQGEKAKALFREIEDCGKEVSDKTLNCLKFIDSE